MKILIATDGSEFSQNAVKKCCKIVAAKHWTDVKIITAVEIAIPMVAEPFGASNEYYMQVTADLRKAAKEAVAVAEQILNENLPDQNFSVQTEVLTGNAKQTIIDGAKQFEADLIVVGSHGYGFFDRMLLGSVSNYVVQHAPCSVLVVRNKGK